MARAQRDIPRLAWRQGWAYVEWYDPAKRRTYRRSLGTKGAAEARIGFARFLAGCGDAVFVRLTQITVRECLADYWREHVEPKVVDKARQRDIIRNLLAYFGDTPVKALGIPESRAYAQCRRDGTIAGSRWRNRDNRKAADSTIRRELGLLIAAINHAVRWKRLARNDAPAIELPTAQRSPEAPWLTKTQIGALFRLARGDLSVLKEWPGQRLSIRQARSLAHALQRARGSDLEAFVHIAYYTAARRRSIERLRQSQIDLKNSRINLHPEDAPATKKRKPIVPLYPEIRPLVENLFLKYEGSEWLFGEPHDFYREFVKLCAVLGIKAHPHQLRHSRATHMLMDGEDPYRVARLLGDSLTTVDRNYGHTAVDYLATTSRVDDAGHEAELPIDSAIVPIRSRRRRDKRSTARAIETPRVLDFFVKPDAAEGEPPDATAAGVSEVGSEPAAGVSEQALADGAEGAEFRLVDLRTAVKELAASRGVDVTYELLLRFGASSASGVPVERRDDFIAEAERLAGRRARPADLASDVLHVPGQDHA